MSEFLFRQQSHDSLTCQIRGQWVPAGEDFLSIQLIIWRMKADRTLYLMLINFSCNKKTYPLSTGISDRTLYLMLINFSCNKKTYPLSTGISLQGADRAAILFSSRPVTSTLSSWIPAKTIFAILFFFQSVLQHLSYEKFNKNCTLRLHLIKMSPHSPSIASHMRKWLKVVEGYIIRLFFRHSPLWLDNFPPKYNHLFEYVY